MLDCAYKDYGQANKLTVNRYLHGKRIARAQRIMDGIAIQVNRTNKAEHNVDDCQKTVLRGVERQSGKIDSSILTKQAIAERNDCVDLSQDIRVKLADYPGLPV